MCTSNCHAYFYFGEILSCVFQVRSFEDCFACLRSPDIYWLGGKSHKGRHYWKWGDDWIPLDKRTHWARNQVSEHIISILLSETAPILIVTFA